MKIAPDDSVSRLVPMVNVPDTADVLAKGPAPRIMLVHGGVYPVHLAMTSFGTFLVAMGYPEAKIRDPGNGDWSYSPYSTTAWLAGIVVNLVSTGEYYDIALRDFGLMVAAIALARLATTFHHREEAAA